MEVLPGENGHTARADSGEMDTLTVDLEMIVRAEHHDPFRVLGVHALTAAKGSDPGRGMVIRAFLPQAHKAWVVDRDDPLNPLPLERLHPDGLFQTVLPGREPSLAYELRVLDRNGNTQQFEDPYHFPPLLADFDLFLIGEGSHYKNYERLGAHLRFLNGVAGVHFAVWAPNAKRVSVIGDFNEWDGRRHPMRSRGQSGVWELFMPGLTEGVLYKFEVKSCNRGTLATKGDPYGFCFEPPPGTASRACGLEGYQWRDEQWMSERERKNWLESPLSFYEVHLGSWRRVPEEGDRCLTYGELADRLIPYVREMGFSHIELLPIAEHPFDGSWGYQTTGYFAPTSRFGSPQDLMTFVDRFHQSGIGVILDWDPAHFPKDEHGLATFDGTHLYEHADSLPGELQDKGRLSFNYGRREVSNFLLSNALFWIEKYHLDGLRLNAVASMLYLDNLRKAGEWLPDHRGGYENLEAINFLRRFNELIHQYHPGVLTIAEESTAWPGFCRPTRLGGLGFSLKWNTDWMQDMLVYFSKDPAHRKFHHESLALALLPAFSENFVLALSHHEVDYGKRSLLDKMPGSTQNEKFGNLRLLFGYMYGQPGKKLLFMGGEFGQGREWNHDQSLTRECLQWELHRKLSRYTSDLNRLYISQPALHELDFRHSGFQWIDFHDRDNGVVSFIRRGHNLREFVVCAYNFTSIVRDGYRIGVPKDGYYQELLNSDSQFYGGSNLGNWGGKMAEPIPWQGYPHSLQLILPPLSALFLKVDAQRH